jgi:DNA polymerase-3 subunit delta'
MLQFKDVIGQFEIKQHLAEMVEQNRLSHALLFLGKEGSGAIATCNGFCTIHCFIAATRACGRRSFWWHDCIGAYTFLYTS